MKNSKGYSKKIIFLSAIAPGLYPIFFYYSKNFPLVNSWEHLGFFLVTFLLFPIIIFFIANAIAARLPFQKYRKYVLPFLNIFTLLYLLKVCYYIGIEKDKILIAAVIAGVVALLLHKQLLKIVFFELLLAVIGLISLVFTMINFLSISEDWRVQPDKISEVEFVKKPNIYVLQTDGYENFSELKKGYYDYDNSKFENFLTQANFKFYPDYRSNYSTTLESNVTLFNMKHHYYNNTIEQSEIYNGRNMIISQNTVLDAFKQNDYKTYFVTETPYLIANRPRFGFDATNFPYSDMKYIRNGARRYKDIEPSLQEFVVEQIEQPKFMFVQLLNPWHITSINNKNSIKKNEREKYFERLEETNAILERTITYINANDPDAIVVLMADHGGYVGMRHTGEKRTKNVNRDFQYSIFGANLAISWSNNSIPTFDDELKSSVNLFRVLFSYLSENEQYLKHLQENGSYLIIEDGAEDGIYQTIDTNGNIVFKALDSLSF